MAPRHKSRLQRGTGVYDDLARRAFPGSWFNLVAVVILAFSTSYPVEHPNIFYSVLAAHSILSGIRLWLLSARETVFAGRLETWRRLLCGSMVACGLAWGLFGATANFLYTSNAAETIL